MNLIKGDEVLPRSLSFYGMVCVNGQTKRRRSTPTTHSATNVSCLLLAKATSSNVDIRC